MESNQAWIAAFRRIPADLEDALALGLTTGAEIAVQKIVRLEPDFMILRGRLAGTQDTGRIVLVPYAQLTFAAITRMLKDTEVEEIFGKGEPAAPPTLAGAPAEPSAPAAEAATVNDPAALVNPVKKPEQVSKTMLLAKLRERMKDGGGPARK
jgi:hypothetical protein